MSDPDYHFEKHELNVKYELGISNIFLIYVKLLHHFTSKKWSI